LRILLMGNPNVGKSVVFSQLTGLNVIASNYPGTTVEYTRGIMRISGKEVEVIDVPGTYSLEPGCQAEEVAVQMLDQGDVIINVVDATNLERNLSLTLQLLGKRIPMVIALNLWDEAQHKGIEIDVEAMERYLQVPVIPTVGVTGKGLKELAETAVVATARRPPQFSIKDRWAYIGSIVEKVQSLQHRHHTLLERLQDISIDPLTGLPLAAIVLYVAFKVVVTIGEGLIGGVCEPLLENWYKPLLIQLSQALNEQGLLHDILLGKVSQGVIDLEGSLGLLSTGIYVAFGVVLPYLFAFYLVLGFLEDFGYLPRLAILLDKVMHKLGMHGYSIIPMMLGVGCNVPGALAIRNLESRRERFIASLLMVVAVPCMAQLAMIAGLVGRYGGEYLALVFACLFTVWVVLGLFADRCVGGYTPSLLMEIPSYRLPNGKAQAKKLWVRVRGFLKEGVPYVLGGILVINLMYVSGVVTVAGRLLQPIITGIFGLPAETVGALMIGFLRKDVAVAMLQPLGLSPLQVTLATVILAIYFPCSATFSVLIMQLGWRDMLKAAVIMIATALVTGGVLNLVLLPLFSPRVLAPLLLVGSLILLLCVPGKSERQEMNDPGGSAFPA